MEIDTFFKWKRYFHFVFGLYRLLAAYFYAWNITSISRVLGWLDLVGSQSTLGRLVCRPFPCWRIWERWTMFYCSAFFGCKNWYGMRYDSPFPANPIQAHIRRRAAPSVFNTSNCSAIVVLRFVVVAGSFQETGVAVTEEPIFFIDGVSISLHDALLADQCWHKHHQRRLGQVKVRHHGVNDLEAIARRNEKSRVHRTGFNRSVISSRRFDRAQTGDGVLMIVR